MQRLLVSLFIGLSASVFAQSPDPIMGDYEGTTSKGSKIVAQVIALGDGKYQANLLPEFDKRVEAIGAIEGQLKDKKVEMSSGTLSAALVDGKLTGKQQADPQFTFELKKVERLSPTMGAKPPKGAIVLFDGKNLDEWQLANGQPAGWKITAEGAMEVVPKSGSIESKKKFGDVKLHVEFKTPFLPKERGQHRGNSGVYLQGNYEVQVLDSYGLEGLDNDCGGIYKVGKPLMNMCAPPGQWQTYDITFKAAKFDDNSTKSANARITVDQNGKTIQKDLELPGPTGGSKTKVDQKDPMPILLQDHGNLVQFRNIWIQENPGAADQK